MAKNFGQYTGGITPIQGIENYGNRTADQITNSIGNISQVLTKGVNDYYTGKFNNEVLDNKNDATAKTMADRLAVLSQDPELVSSGVLDGFAEKLNSLKDARNKSYPAKLAINHEAEAYNAAFNDRLKDAEFVWGRKVTRDTATGLGEIPDTEKGPANAVSIESGKVPWSTNLTAVKNRERLEKWADEAEAGGAVIDRKSMYRNWHKQKQIEISQSKILSADQKALALDALASSENSIENFYHNQANAQYGLEIFDPLGDVVAQELTGADEKAYNAKIKTPEGVVLPAPRASAPVAPAPVAPAKVEPTVVPAPAAVKAAEKPADVVAPAPVAPAPVAPVVTPPAVLAPAEPAPVAPVPAEPAPVAPATAPAKVEPTIIPAPEALKATPPSAPFKIKDVLNKVLPAGPKPYVPPARLKAADDAADDALYPQWGAASSEEAIRKGAEIRTEGDIGYEMKKGDTAKSVAKKFGLDVNTVEWLFRKNDTLPREGDWIELGKVDLSQPISESEATGGMPSETSSDASTESETEAAPAGLPAPAPVPVKPDPKANMVKIREMAVKEDTKQRFITADRSASAHTKAAEYAQRILDDITSPESIASGFAPSVDANGWTRWKRANPAAGGTMEFTANVAQYITAAGGVVKAVKGVQGIKAMASAQGFANLVSKGYKPLLDKAAKAYNGKIPQAVKDKILKTATLGAKAELEAAKVAARSSGMKMGAGMLLADQFVTQMMGTDDWEHPASTYIHDDANIENDMVTMVDTLAGIRNYGIGLDPDKITPLQRTKMADYLNTKIASFNAKGEEFRAKAKSVYATPARSYEQIVGVTKDGEVDPNNAASGFVGQTVEAKSNLIGMGYLEQERKLTAEEKKSRLQAYMMNKYKDSNGAGYIPSGFEAAYKALVPESSLKIVQTAIGPMFHDGAHWKQVEMPKQQSLQDIRKETIGLFGKRTADGSLAPVELGEGTGVHLAGLFSGGDEALAKYKEQISELSSGRGAIKALDKIIAQFGHSLNPTLIGEAKIHLATLRAATRIEVIGVGTVSEMEQKMLNDANPDTTSVFRFDAVDRAKLRVLKDKLERKMKLISGVNNIGIKIIDRDDQSVERDLRLSK